MTSALRRFGLLHNKQYCTEDNHVYSGYIFVHLFTVLERLKWNYVANSQSVRNDRFKTQWGE